MSCKTLLGLAVAVTVSAPAAAQTVDELIAKNLQAKGGLEKIKAVQSGRMTGRMTMGPGVEAPITLELKRPRNTRLEFTVQGHTGVQAYDGKQAWGIPPMANRRAEPLPDEMARDIDAQADLDGPLVDYKAKGHQVELAGKETVDGAETWKLKLTPKGGDAQYVFLDASSFLEIRNEAHRLVRGQELVHRPLQLARALLDDPVQVVGAPVHQHPRRHHADDAPALDHRQVPDAKAAHRLNRLVPTHLRTDRARARGHPLRNRKVAPARIGIHHALQQVALGEDTFQFAPAVDDDDRTDPQPVHLLHDVAEQARGLHQHRLGQHHVSDGQRRSLGHSDHL